MRGICRSAALAFLVLAPVVAAQAQSRRPVYRNDRRSVYEPRRQLSLSVGAFRYDSAGDDRFPMAALRVDWKVASWVRTEVGATYALGDLNRRTAAGERVETNLMTASLGVQGELPVHDYVRPYAGAAAGLFGRYDDKDAGTVPSRFWRPMFAVPVGIRFRLPNGVGLRGEARLRYDEHRSGAASRDWEHTVGVSFGF